MGIALTPFVLFTVKEPKRDKSAKQTHSCEASLIILKDRVILILRTYLMPGIATLCIAGSIRNAAGYVWAYNTEPFYQKIFDDDIIAIYMSVIPLVGGSIGAVVGGVISDLLVKNRGPYARIWVLIISQVSALYIPVYFWIFLHILYIFLDITVYHGVSLLL